MYNLYPPFSQLCTPFYIITQFSIKSSRICNAHLAIRSRHFQAVTFCHGFTALSLLYKTPLKGIFFQKISGKNILIYKHPISLSPSHEKQPIDKTWLRSSQPQLLRYDTCYLFKVQRIFSANNRIGPYHC